VKVQAIKTHEQVAKGVRLRFLCYTTVTEVMMIEAAILFAEGQWYTRVYPKVSGLCHNEINNNNNNNKHSLRSNTKGYGGKTH
jgi:hypothetical protein